VRLFAAVELDPAVKAAAVEAGQRLRARAAVDAKWIPEANLHITLWFLGEVADADVPAVLSALQPPIAIQPFTLEIGGLGAFPQSGRPRVLWLDVRRGASHLKALNAEVGRRLQPLGFEPERRTYSAHLTLARMRDTTRPSGSAGTLRRALAEVPSDAGQSRVTGVTLFRSRLSPKGATYEPVLRVPLEG
jgi:2'-5' RNA ligase